MELEVVADENRRNKSTSGLEGNLYQVKLAAYSLLKLMRKSIEENGTEFVLFNEYSDGGKFDDFYFEFGDSCYFLQIKHKLNRDNNETISIEALLSQEDSKFTMVKYCQSYREIVQQKKYRDRIENVCLFTNIDLAADAKELYVTEYGDNIFKIDNGKSQYYKFNREFAIVLHPIVEEFSLKSLAATLANCIVSECGVSRRDPKIRDHFDILQQEVFSIKSKVAEFKRSFIENDDTLLPTTKIFRSFFISELSLAWTKHNKPPREMNELRFNISKAKKLLSAKEWPRNLITLEDILDFLDHMIMATLQPNEAEMDAFILDEMHAVVLEIEKSVRCGSVGIAMDQLMVEIINWSKNSSTKCLTFAKGKDILTKIFGGLKTLIATDKVEYCQELQSFQLDFVVNNLRDVIHEFMDNGQHDILHIQSIANPKLCAIKVYRALESLTNVNYHFQSLLQLMRTDQAFTNFIELFDSIADVHLLVLECPEIPQSFHKITRLMEKCISAKIVLISQNEERFVQHLQENVKRLRIQQNINNMRDFTKHSQEVLMNQLVKVQNSIVRLGEVIRLEDALKSFDEKMLSDLVKKEICEIDAQLRRLNLGDLRNHSVVKDIQNTLRRTGNEAKRVERRLRKLKF